MTNEPTTDIRHAVEMRGVVKRFPGVLANDHVDFDLRAGEVHALLGENGAGKSTLMNILIGLYQPDEGGLLVKGRPATFHSPRDAIAAGLGMVHQHFTLVPSQSVTENVLLGLNTPRFLLRLPKYEAEVGRLADQFGLKVDPAAKVWQLSVGEQQRVEILKMLYRGVDVLIMDEPTAVLAPVEVGELFKTLRAMTARGQAVVFISHKLDEVMAIADRITVLRRGRVTAGGLEASATNKAELAKLMVGREVLFAIDKPPSQLGDVVLSLQAVRAENDKGLPALRDVSFEVRAGEILGVAGVAGNGQSELAQVITGLRACAGQVKVHGHEVGNRPVMQAIREGVAHVPEDRTGVGSAPNLSVTDNLIMKSYRRAPIANGWAINQVAARQQAESLKAAYQIAAPSIDTQARLLSGGNLQRLILAREISTQPQLMIAVQPTRGLDVGATEAVHQLLLAQRAAGAAIVMISEDLDELLTLSDRVAVMYGGRIVGVLDAQGIDLNRVGLMMTGVIEGDRP